jgi:DNA-directed RNA polymerase specialized sigma subunit
VGKKHYWENFGDEVSDEIEKSYNRIVRHEEYSLEKDALSKAVFFGSEEELYKENISEYIMRKSVEESERKKLDNDIELLNKALCRLKKEHPSEYDVVQCYFFSDIGITMSEIGRSRDASKQKIFRILRRAYAHLKEYINLYKNE